MSPRRIVAGAPVAVALAYLAHWAVFGASHLAGGVHAEFLAACIAAALGASVAVAFGAGFVRGLPLATNVRNVYPAALLIAGGLVAFAAIEASEGHALVTGSLGLAALALGPLSLLAAEAARRIGRAAERAGAEVAQAIASRPRVASYAFAHHVFAPAAFAARTLPSRPSRGRAPPRNA